MDNKILIIGGLIIAAYLYLQNKKKQAAAPVAVVAGREQKQINDAPVVEVQDYQYIPPTISNPDPSIPQADTGYYYIPAEVYTPVVDLVVNPQSPRPDDIVAVNETPSLPGQTVAQVAAAQVAAEQEAIRKEQIQNEYAAAVAKAKSDDEIAAAAHEYWVSFNQAQQDYAIAVAEYYPDNWGTGAGYYY
jgi:hypothetical protein